MSNLANGDARSMNVNLGVLVLMIGQFVLWIFVVVYFFRMAGDVRAMRSMMEADLRRDVRPQPPPFASAGTGE